VDLALSQEEEQANEYCKFRRWLIQKEKEFVAQQLKKNQQKASQEESKNEQPTPETTE
jgi:hypothetical protein